VRPGNQTQAHTLSRRTIARLPAPFPTGRKLTVSAVRYGLLEVDLRRQPIVDLCWSEASQSWPYQWERQFVQDFINAFKSCAAPSTSSDRPISEARLSRQVSSAGPYEDAAKTTASVTNPGKDWSFGAGQRTWATARDFVSKRARALEVITSGADQMYSTMFVLYNYVAAHTSSLWAALAALHAVHPQGLAFAPGERVFVWADWSRALLNLPDSGQVITAETKADAASPVSGRCQSPQLL
jgi:hypothetical protein